jgi:Tol biopolymer transport system component
LTVESSPTVNATAEATEEVEATATAEIGERAEITAAAELTETDELTSSDETVSTPSADVVTRQEITLPTDLPTSIQIVGGELLSDLIPDVDPAVAELSPDGSQVAWLVPGEAQRVASLCIAQIVDGGQNCFPVDGYQGLPYHLVWSPDREWLAFSEDPAAQALESDIWLYDVENGDVTNRTDEQAAGRYADLEDDYVLDYLPMWDPATGMLYFWRSSPDGDGSFDLDLMRLDPTTEAEPVVVRSLGKSLGDGLVRFGWQRFYLQGPSTIAPDGSQLAVAIAPAQEMDLSASKSLWLIDLVDESAEPTQLVTSLAWQAALPQWANQPAVARGLQWTADGQGIVVAALSSDLRLPLLLTYYVDAGSGEVTPLVDFSSSRDRAAFFRMDAAGNAMRFLVPWTVAMVPNANVVLLVTDMAGAARVLGAPLPPQENGVSVLYEHVSPGYEVWTRSSSGSNGEVLVYGLLLQSVPQE